MKSPLTHPFRAGFTLVELLTVMAIIAVLMGILLPAINSAIESAKKTQAKSDEMAIVTAVKGYYTEYGKYPVATPPATGDFTYDGLNGNTNNKLMIILRAKETTGTIMNPRKIVFLEAPDAKNLGVAGKERAGMATATGGGTAASPTFLDPWGNPYNILIDMDYDNSVTNPYGAPATGNAGSASLSTGVAIWTVGRDAALGTKGNNNFKGSDDVISWQ